MSVNAIYGCKLYKASSRKDKIKAGIANPINLELVQQLNEYLDDDYQDEIASKPEPADTQPTDDTEADDKQDDEKAAIRPSEHHSSGGGGSISHSMGDLGGGPSFEAESSSESENEPSPEAEPADVGEATKVASQPIMSCCDFVSSEIDAIVGLLNSREDSAGICRSIVKDNELWLHYKDSINLNNVMEPVIALLNASNYNMLDFNRLARTENAIVFSITESSKPVQPIQEATDEK